MSQRYWKVYKKCVLPGGELICKDPAMWRLITINNASDGGLMLRYRPSMFRHAVDRSQGQLIELTLCEFGDDELLNYAVDRSSSLRFLRLVKCHEMKPNCVTEAVKKLPHLEELHLTRMLFLQSRDIAIIGVSCPMLKSFSFNQPHYYDFKLIDFYRYNYDAVAIAKTIPNLRHLQLVGHWMRNEGLEAILDGCPHLQSLNILDCYELDLRGALGRRCDQLIIDQGRRLDTFQIPVSDINYS